MPIQLDLSEMLHHPGMRKPYDVDVPCTPELELECTAPVTGHMVFTNTGNVLVIQGTLNGRLKTECPRCLGDVESDVQATVDEEFTVEHDQVTGFADDEDDPPDPALKALFEGGHMLNVTELVRQNLVLAMPTEPLCRAECAGLCPICGANRNETDCACEAPVDSPFAALAGLYQDSEEESAPESK